MWVLLTSWDILFGPTGYKNVILLFQENDPESDLYFLFADKK